jgi:hypothetical protein
MAYIHTIVAGQFEWVLYALSPFIRALPDALLLLQRRGFGRGFGTRRRPGGIFRALSALVLVFLVGPIVILALIAYVIYGAFRGRGR